MPDRKSRAELRTKQAAEVESSQADLRNSIAETERLLNESDKMLRRHRTEWDADEAGRKALPQTPAKPKPGKRP